MVHARRLALCWWLCGAPVAAAGVLIRQSFPFAGSGDATEGTRGYCATQDFYGQRFAPAARIQLPFSGRLTRVDIRIGGNGWQTPNWGQHDFSLHVHTSPNQVGAQPYNGDVANYSWWSLPNPLRAVGATEWGQPIYETWFDIDSPVLSAGGSYWLLFSTYTWSSTSYGSANVSESSEPGIQTDIYTGNTPVFVPNGWIWTSDASSIVEHQGRLAVNVYVAPTCPGDFDGSSAVDLADHDILAASLGVTAGALGSEGDIDGDTDVDLADYAQFQTHYGARCP